jgi:hypothetical protein
MYAARYLNWTTAPRGLAAVAALTLAVLGVTGSTASQGCIYDSSLLEGGAPNGSVCANPDNAGELPAIPLPPAENDPSNTPALTVVLAMQSIDVGVGVGLDGGLMPADGGLIPSTAPQPHLGYDLDRVCTCCGAAPSCNQPDGSKENCDDDVGRDNTGIKLFRSLGSTAQAGNLDVNQAMYGGLYGIVLEISDYNGQPNDQQVTVSVFASNGIALAGGAGPRHDGTDPWTLDPRYLYNGGPPVGTSCYQNSACNATYSDPFAYVSCGVLVANPTVVPFTFGGRAAFGGAVMNLRQPYIVGNLVQTTVMGGNLGWAITNGSVTGRWQSEDLLSNMATIPDPTTDAGMFLCGNDPLYMPLKSIICGLQDIVSVASEDNTGKSCDSISMAFGFTAAQAVLGVVAPIPPTPSGCGTDAGSFTDTCP